MKIVILDGHTENPGDLSWGGFEEFGEIVVYPRTVAENESKTKALVLERALGAEIVITNKTALDAEIIEKLSPKLKYIGTLSTGFNIIDLEKAREFDIPVCNVPAYGTKAVAQHTMALLLELTNKVGVHNQSVKDGEWAKSADFCYWKNPIVELAGKTLGIIGYGRIGQAVAEMAAAFGMNILALNSHAKEKAPARLVSMQELLAESDIISLHCPLTEETKNIINSETIAQMKHGVIILNTSRGLLIDERALAEGLASGKVGGAGLDVVSVEPIESDNVLIAAPRCVITPHIAWAARESRARLMDIAVGNLKAFLAGEPHNVVN